MSATAAPRGVLSDASNKQRSVEQIYQKKTQLEHILLRPDTYSACTGEAGRVNARTNFFAASRRA